MDGGGSGCADRALFVYGFAKHIKNAPQGGLAHWNADRGARINGIHAAHKPIGGAHGHRAYPVVPEQLLNLGGQGNILAR